MVQLMISSTLQGRTTTPDISQGDAGGYIYGYNVNPEGNIILPATGPVKVVGLTLEETRKLLQESADKVFKNSTVECKLLSSALCALSSALFALGSLTRNSDPGLI